MNDMFFLTSLPQLICRSALIQDPATHDFDITELIDNTGEETNQVETDFSVDALNIFPKQTHKIHADNYKLEHILIPSNEPELSEDKNEFTENIGNGHDYLEYNSSQTLSSEDPKDNHQVSDDKATVSFLSAPHIENVVSAPSYPLPVAAPASSKQCPDNLSACLSVCQPVLYIRVLAFTLCRRECWERCGEEEEENPEGGITGKGAERKPVTLEMSDDLQLV